jgi:hypothetical protein
MILAATEVSPGEFFALDLARAAIDRRLREGYLFLKKLADDLELISSFIVLGAVWGWDRRGLRAGDQPIVDVAILKGINKGVSAHKKMKLLF